MTGHNKDTLQKLKELSSSLQLIVDKLRSQYRILSSLANVMVVCFLNITFLLIFCKKLILGLGSAIDPFLMLISMDAILVIAFIRLLKAAACFRKTYFEGRDILKDMADIAEWTRYKKRLIYKGKEESVSNVVEGFFKVTEKAWSPFRTENRYYFMLVTIFIPFIFSSFIVFFIKVIWGI